MVEEVGKETMSQLNRAQFSVIKMKRSNSSRALSAVSTSIVLFLSCTYVLFLQPIVLNTLNEDLSTYFGYEISLFYKYWYEKNIRISPLRMRSSEV